MRIGLLTFHCAHNYGAILQTLATLTFLKKKGLEVEVVDYRPDFLIKPYAVFRLKYYFARNIKTLLFRFCTEFFNIGARYSRWRIFDDFIKRKINRAKYDPFFCNRYDYIIIGSDQVWSKDLSCGFFDDCYIANVSRDDSCKVLSYAASKGSSVLSYQDYSFLSRKLKTFYAVSVREESLQSELYEHGINSTLVCDPVFLLYKNDWLQLTALEKKIEINGKYVLVYEVVENSRVLDQAMKFAKKYNWNVVYVEPIFKKRKKKEGVRYILNANPFQFIDLINNAEYIITTSFHGTAFSVILRKDFYTLSLSGEIDSRSSSLLKQIGLSNRMVSLTSVLNKTNVNYEQVEFLINNYILLSKSFLLDSLNVGYYG